MKHHVITTMASALVLASTIQVFTKIPMGFIPSEDTNQIFGSAKAAQDISFDAMVKQRIRSKTRSTTPTGSGRFRPSTRPRTSTG